MRVLGSIKSSLYIRLTVVLVTETMILSRSDVPMLWQGGRQPINGETISPPGPTTSSTLRAVVPISAGDLSGGNGLTVALNEKAVERATREAVRGP